MVVYEKPKPCVKESVGDFSACLDNYWDEFGLEDVYVGVVLAVHIDQFGEVIGQSIHLNGPTVSFNDDFMRDLLGEVA